MGDAVWSLLLFDKHVQNLPADDRAAMESRRESGPMDPCSQGDPCVSSLLREESREPLWLIVFIPLQKAGSVSLGEMLSQNNAPRTAPFIPEHQKQSAFWSHYNAARACCPERKGCYNTLQIGKSYQGSRCSARMVTGSAGETS